MSEESAASPKFIKFCQRTEFSPQKGELGALESKESFSFHGESSTKYSTKMRELYLPVKKILTSTEKTKEYTLLSHEFSRKSTSINHEKLIIIPRVKVEIMRGEMLKNMKKWSLEEVL